MVLSFGEVLMDCLPDKNVIGGAPFNVVIHIKRMGKDAAIVSKIGEDELGQQIHSFLKEEGVDAAIQVDGSYKTGYVTVTLNNGQPSYEIHSDTCWEHIGYQELNADVSHLVYGSLALHFPDNKEGFKQYVSKFPDAVKVCDINLREPFYSVETIDFCLSHADVLKINDEELDYLAKQWQVEDAKAEIEKRYGITKLLLTKGAAGAELFWDGNNYSVEAGKVNDLKDTVGAGDSFTSMFIYGLLCNKEFEQNLADASRFAAKICETNGAIPTDLSLYQSF